MHAQTFQFRRHPAEQARRLAGGPDWGRRSLVSLAGGPVLLLGGLSFWGFQPCESVLGLIVVGAGLLTFSAVAFAAWLWRALHPQSGGRPWGRLLVLGLLAVWLLSAVASQARETAWIPALNGLGWALAVGLLVRLGWLARRPGPGTRLPAGRPARLASTL
jgi:hypothetical protein